jgi:hypothetical protein
VADKPGLEEQIIKLQKKESDRREQNRLASIMYKQIPGKAFFLFISRCILERGGSRKQPRKKLKRRTPN